MRWTQFYLYTTREVPSDAEVISHQLMIRAGLIKKLAAGIYTYTPFGWRSLRKLMDIVRRELDSKGACELSMPAIQPAELWIDSGRWAKYGKELLRMEDRHGREFCFGPTHEEVITDLVRHDVKSYKQLPFNLYQIQTKFRDEIRPRFGLMRGREFLMKDAYSFHADAESLDQGYQDMHAAYRAIFEACHLDYSVVEADTGAIGGKDSHEFQVVAETGESVIVRCPTCDYAANVEKALLGDLETPDALEGDLEEVATPGQTTIEDVTGFLGIEANRLVKTLIFDNENEELTAVVVRGDREVNDVAVANFVGCDHLVLASEERVRQATGAPVGYAGPVGLPEEVRLLVDPSLRGLVGFVCGANKADAHFKNVQWERDIARPPGDAEGGQPRPEWVDVTLADVGDPCPRADGKVDGDCGGGELERYRGSEVGHIFKLGSKYSETMGCTYLNERGQPNPMIMGCYGLGIGRTVAAAVEQNHDDDGIIWPRPLAPFEVLLIALNPQDEEVCRVADGLYDDLRAKGLDVLYDDRKERPGVKFKDADLIGVPVRVVVGKKGLANGEIELSARRDRERVMAAPGEVITKVETMLGA